MMRALKRLTMLRVLAQDQGPSSEERQRKATTNRLLTPRSLSHLNRLFPPRLILA